MSTHAEHAILGGGEPIDQRDAELVAGADELEQGRGSLAQHPNALIIAAASTMTLGVTAILLGWFGAARSTLLEEQVPYLISGGLLGVALATIGGLMLFSHWLTVSIREAREREAARRQDHAELLETLHALTSVLDGQEKPNGRARSPRSQRQVRRTSRSS